MQVLVSPKYQVVIPKALRNKLGLKKGTRMHITVKRNSIILVPDRPLKDFRGLLRGTRLDDIREQEERI